MLIIEMNVSEIKSLVSGSYTINILLGFIPGLLIIVLLVLDLEYLPYHWQHLIIKYLCPSGVHMETYM